MTSGTESGIPGRDRERIRVPVRCTGMRIVLLYVVVEVLAVVGLASWIGLGWTLLVLLAGSVLGLLLARREGIRAARALSVAVQNGRLAHSEATDSLLVALGGVLLFVPGLVTDVLGLALLLVAPIARLIWQPPKIINVKFMRKSPTKACISETCLSPPYRLRRGQGWRIGI